MGRVPSPVPTATGLPVDWELAARTAGRLTPPGPTVTLPEAIELVERLRTDAAVAEGHVREVTGLGAGLPLLPADVVDRPAWVDANTQGMAALLDPLVTKLQQQQDRRPGPIAMAIGSRATGAQAGAVLSFLGSRVLGQYEVFGTGGRLLLVAPNVHAAQQALDVPSTDFGLWVCLHEATHRLQFTAVPWLREHFAGEVGRLLSLGESAGLAERLPDALRALRESRGDALALVEVLQGPEQRAVLDRLLALTTLLEGHADHVMDAAGPDVVPSVATIRQRFTVRRRGGGLVDRVLRALLGVEAKVRQYAVGGAFVRHAVLATGMDGFNRVWESPDTLPTRAELDHPGDWVRRIHG